jgi:hypothetical protein
MKWLRRWPLSGLVFMGDLLAKGLGIDAILHRDLKVLL